MNTNEQGLTKHLALLKLNAIVMMIKAKQYPLKNTLKKLSHTSKSNKKVKKSDEWKIQKYIEMLIIIM